MPSSRRSTRFFDLPSLTSLPEEQAALIAGQNAKFSGPDGFVQRYLGPRDINGPETDELLAGFDPLRLAGCRSDWPAVEWNQPRREPIARHWR
jgi:phospholipase C